MTETALQKKVRVAIFEKALIRPGEAVTVAVSGGADSVCLLLLLEELRGEFGFSLQALHVHHGLRGEDADADEFFVQQLCAMRGIDLETHHIDVRALAKEQGIGIEEAGRLARRKAYATKAVVALAHHMDDQAETVLFRAARGTSLAGLGGMREFENLQRTTAEMQADPMRDNSFAATGAAEENAQKDQGGTRLIRPLLGASRREIEAWLRERGQTWREDATNRDEAFARNAIRHRVIPALQETVNEETVSHLAHLAAEAAEADAFLRQEAERRAAELVYTAPSIEGEEPGEEIVLSEELQKLPRILQGYAILQALEQAAGTRRDFGRLHVEQVRSLFALPAGKRLELPHAISAIREHDTVRLVCT